MSLSMLGYYPTQVWPSARFDTHTAVKRA